MSEAGRNTKLVCVCVCGRERERDKENALFDQERLQGLKKHSPDRQLNYRTVNYISSLPDPAYGGLVVSCSGII